MKGGYFMIDFKGVTLIGQFTLTSMAIYKRCVEAAASGKAVFLNNIALLNSTMCTPISAYVVDNGSQGDIFVYFTHYCITVTNTGVVTLTDLNS